MSVALRRSGFTLWMAWVIAAAIGTGAGATMRWTWFSGIGDDSPVAYLTPAFVAAPLILLQYLVLRAFGILSPRGAGLWVAASLLAAVAYIAANQLWFAQVMSRFVPTSPQLTDWMFRVTDYFYPLTFGLAQGIVLAHELHRSRVVFMWALANLGAWIVATTAVAPWLVALVPSPALTAWGAAIFYTTCAAITGIALVAIVKARHPVTAPELLRTSG